MRETLRKLLDLDDTPERIARGAVVGLFLALTPPVWPQSLVAFFVARLFRANRLSAVALTFVTNPLTFPLYMINYVVGVGCLDLAFGWQMPPWTEVWEKLRQIKGFWAGIAEAASIGWRVWVAMFVGGFAVASGASVPLYLGVRRWVLARRLRKGRQVP